MSLLPHYTVGYEQTNSENVWIQMQSCLSCSTSQDPHYNSYCVNIQHVASKKYNTYAFHTETEGVHAVVADVLLTHFSPPFFSALFPLLLLRRLCSKITWEYSPASIKLKQSCNGPHSGFMGLNHFTLTWTLPHTNGTAEKIVLSVQKRKGY